MRAYAGEVRELRSENNRLKNELYESICQLDAWLKNDDYRECDTFDGLNARFLRPLTLSNRFLRTASQQGVRRCPVNFRTPDMVSRKRVRFLPPDKRARPNSTCEAKYPGTGCLSC